ncbi:MULTISPECIES: non-ribosomal peptide synthetase [unclassified Nocardia]|uniref:non-ribosomal peptide synthetase n=1 Tax=unclassified Nocardia TaxID=2637762 RepID=UPI001CE477D4|nr:MULTISPECIES: non-ribosomal peptide synthetase [unclassified Nocardia]
MSTIETARQAVTFARPLSAAQRRAWFVQTRDPDDTTLNTCLAFRLTGALDPARLRRAVETVVARHDILRTTYGCGPDGEPVQLVRDELPGWWREYDVSTATELGRDRRVRVLIHRALGRAFDLADEAPLRTTLIRTGATEFVFVLIAHTICWDDDSWDIFRSEVNAAYHGTELPTLTTQFVDIAVCDDRADESALGFWRDTLRPLPGALELPGRPTGVYPPPVGSAARQSTSGARRSERCTVAVPADLVGQVSAFATAYQVSAFAVLFASYQAIVHRYTAATDFLVAVPVTDRDPASVSMIGYFGDTLLLRATPRPGDRFADVVVAVESHCAAAFANQGVGIDRVVRELNPDRSAGRDGLAELVQIGFGAREGARGFEFDGINCAAVEFGGHAAQLPLSATAVLDGSAVRLEAEYRNDVLSAELVEQLLRHWLTLLRCALADPARPLGALELFEPDERAELLALSRGPVVPTTPGTVVELFGRRVAATPDAVAVVAPGRAGAPDLELTYAALHQRANRLAHWLIRQGIGAEDIVALRLGTSVEFVVAVLGVLAAGAAYLPVDPAGTGAGVACRLLLDAADLAAAEQAAAVLPWHAPTDAERVRPLRPDNLAYLVHTSGSTGKPKGVPVSHAALTEHLTGFAAEWGIGPADRLLQSAPVGFDASLLDIFVTLTVGARLVIPKPDAFNDIPYIAELIARYGVTVLHLVPSTLSTLLLLPEVSEWRALRHVPVGGEALLGEVADRFAGVFDAELRNHYGPTEAVVSATHFTVDGPQGTGIVPIGRPNRNVYAHLLDARLQPVPHGVVGEIYLGGNQLARGYLNRPGRTAARFVADPYLPGQRLYRTGDLARRGPDGVLEFVGRADAQVKVRGHRVELGEVEAAIAGHPAVAQCVVIAATDAAIGTMLAAYVVPVPGAAIELESVRAHADTVLPGYLRPAAYTVLAAIPRTANGKLDRSALPVAVRTARRPYREPVSANEIRLAEEFGRLLGLARVGAEDSFFELGGHSLLAHRLLAWIRDAFGIGLDVRVLFDTPSVAGLAALLEARTAEASRVVRAPELSDEVRRRVVQEWATGVELSDVPTLSALLGRGRTFPADRVAMRCGTTETTYGEFFAGPPGALGGLAAALDATARRGEQLVLPGVDGATIVLDGAALAAAVADRRAVLADSRPRTDPALGRVAVRSTDAPLRSVRCCVELLAALADGATLVIDPEVVENDSARKTFSYRVAGYAGVVARGPAPGSRRVRPVPGAKVLVLDESSQPVPPGVPGAVYVGGAALVSGYRDASAADRFVADPFVPGARLFRTDDHAHWDAEGWLVLAANDRLA